MLSETFLCDTLQNTPREGVLLITSPAVFATRSLSPQESRVVLTLSARRQREVTRAEIIGLLGGTPKAADHVIESLRHKGWLERATWGRYLLVPPDQGPEALGDSNLLARASRIADPYYIGFATAAAHYGFTTQHRSVIFIVTPARVRSRRVGESHVRIVNQPANKFFGFELVDAFGYSVMMSDREKTAVDCVDYPGLAGGVGEAATILAAASRKFDWSKAAGYLERVGSRALIQRFGWLTDHVQADLPADLRGRLLDIASRSRRTWLGSDPRRTGAVEEAIGFNKAWHVFVNVSAKELHESEGLGRRRVPRKKS